MDCSHEDHNTTHTFQFQYNNISRKLPIISFNFIVTFIPNSIKF